MKNYTYKWKLDELGFVEVSKEEYSDSQKDMMEFIENMSNIIKSANCGWDGVRYALMKNTKHDYYSAYMVLYCKGAERWIPIEGNSKGCNFSVLGENIW